MTSSGEYAMNSPSELLSVARQCQSVVTQYEADDPVLWGDIALQIDTLIHDDGHITQKQCDAIHFGSILSRQYDAASDKDEMQPLYTLYYMIKMLYA